MPKLQVMELWNARNQPDTRKLGELIFVFCFEITADLATIVVEFNWPFTLSEDASNAWEQLAMRRTQRRPVIKRKSPCYVEARLNARARVIKHLKLSKYIVQQAPFV
ncbi:F-box domain-containing protein [Colletotrichum sojae]|uniref:F-box domain-containing protein n=1 Tax=Colletotrichum sojae TaxID=2175907 RepID=A0A8H6N1B3_9PEZI|nr:F-box domain-containing protein [Colletotrichum sojae]